MMHLSPKRYGVPFLVLLMVSCVSKPLTTDVGNVGEWEAKARIVDKKKGTLHTVNLSILGFWPHHMRMEATGPFGVPLLTMTLKEKVMQALLPQEKRLLQGLVSEQKAKALLQVEVDPRWFLLFAFDRPVSGREWVCEVDQEKKPSLCKRQNDGMRITWNRRDETRRTVEIDHPQFQLLILFQNAQPKVEVDPSAFRLSAPEGYRTETI